jgi:hypothetical protein
MAGQIRRLIDELMQLRTARATGSTHFVRAHLILHGINPDQYSLKSEDDPERIRILEKMITDFRANNS